MDSRTYPTYADDYLSTHKAEIADRHAREAAQSYKMGCGMSTEEKEGKQRNEEIENQLKRDKLSQRNEIKMLLLGTI